MPAPVIDAASRVRSLTATSTGLLLVLDQVQDNGVPLSSTIWSSADGLTWQLVHSVDSPVSAAGHGPLGVVMTTNTDLLTSVDDGARPVGGTVWRRDSPGPA